MRLIDLNLPVLNINNMALINLYNPANVSDSEVKEYVDILINFGKASYEARLHLTEKTLVEALRTLDEKSRFEDEYSCKKMQINQIFHPIHMENLGYAVWIESQQIPKAKYALPNIYVGTIVDKLITFSGEKGIVSRSKTDTFSGLDLFENYSESEDMIFSVFNIHSQSNYFFQDIVRNHMDTI